MCDGKVSSLHTLAMYHYLLNCCPDTATFSPAPSEYSSPVPVENPFISGLSTRRISTILSFNHAGGALIFP